METDIEYLQKNVNPILEPLVIEILANRPKNIPEFINEYINKKFLQKSIDEPKIKKIESMAFTKNDENVFLYEI